jgi:hypothetical protein
MGLISQPASTDLLVAIKFFYGSSFALPVRVFDGVLLI